jgi:hypothetical protein
MYANRAARVLLGALAAVAVLTATGCSGSSSSSEEDDPFYNFPFGNSTPEPEPSPTNSANEPLYHGTFIQKMSDGTEYECIWASDGGNVGGSLWCADQLTKK